MGSNVLTWGLRQRIMPFQAILRHELRTLVQSWLVRIWLAAAVLLTLLIAAGNWGQFRTAPLIASLLFPYLVFPWFLVVMVLGVTPVSGARAEALADGFLSRPVTRQEYFLSVWAARVVLVLAGYLVVIVPAVLVVALARRPVAADTVTCYGIIAALAVAGLVLSFQVSLALLLGTLLRRPLLAIVVLLFLWGPANLLLHTFRLEYLSPISLSQAMPTLLRQSWSAGSEEAAGQAKDPEEEALRLATANFLSVLSGGSPQKPREAKPTFFESTEYQDFSLLKVLLGYGVPTVATVGLATWVFARRDL